MKLPESNHLTRRQGSVNSAARIMSRVLAGLCFLVPAQLYASPYHHVINVAAGVVYDSNPVMVSENEKDVLTARSQSLTCPRIYAVIVGLAASIGQEDSPRPTILKWSSNSQRMCVAAQ